VLDDMIEFNSDIVSFIFLVSYESFLFYLSLLITYPITIRYLILIEQNLLTGNKELNMAQLAPQIADALIPISIKINKNISKNKKSINNIISHSAETSSNSND